MEQSTLDREISALELASSNLQAASNLEELKQAVLGLLDVVLADKKSTKDAWGTF